MREEYKIVGSYDNQRIKVLNSERSINLFEFIDENVQRPAVLISTSGIVNSNLSFTPETGGSRGTFVFQDTIFQVFGPSVYKITGPTGTLVQTKIGTINNTTTYVGIDANQYQVIFVDGVQGWIWDVNASTFSLITDTGFPPMPLDVCYLDGFFIVVQGGTNSFQLSSLNQGMVWSGASTIFSADPGTNTLSLTSSAANFRTGVPVMLTATTYPPELQPNTIYYVIMISAVGDVPGIVKLATSYANAIAGTAIDFGAGFSGTATLFVQGQLQQGFVTSHPGTMVGCKTLHRRLFLFSQNFTEVWENAGLGTNLPFRRNNSLLMEVGSPAVGSIVVGFDRMFFLAQDRDGLAGVMEVKGSEAIPVSNRALDYQLAQYAAIPTTNPPSGVSDSRGILIKENGLIFYRLNFTLADHTFVLNVSMSTVERVRWHEEEVLNGSRHPAQTHAYYKGVNYYGDYSQSNFYIVSDQVTTNNNEQIKRTRIGVEMSPQGYKRQRIDRFQLDLMQGSLSTGALGFTETRGIDAILTTPYAINAEPTVYLSYSKDGGQTYGAALHATMGKIGDTTHLTVWRKLGTTPRGQGFTPKIEFFSPIPFIILGAAWDYEVLPE